MELSDRWTKIFYFLILPVIAVSSYLSTVWLGFWAGLAILWSIILTAMGE